jgi:protein TonB
VTTAADTEPFTEANFRANYASNPKPEYPATARSREWQGKVKLRVQVSAEGLSDTVRVEKSSGYDMLDECAVEAVKRWRFIPAKRGETPVASSVIVPIDFSLTD